jgi:threonine dehydrogenase-like Zn-dependent dehydrogenase
MPKRLAITGPYHVEVIPYEDPALQPNQVLVRTEFASGKHGTTMGMFDGRTFEGQRFDQEMRLFVDQDDASPPKPSPESPWRTGTTGVGTVIAAGSEVTRWREGDRVFGLMDVRETNICQEDRLWALGNVDPELALCIEPAYVAFHAVRESQVRYGDQVAVIGLGVLGLLAVRMAVQGGAEAVYAVDVLPSRRQWAAQNGASHVFDPRAGDVALQIHEANGGKGVDVAIELAGVYPALQTAIRAVRVGGTVCSAGFYQGESKGLWLGREWHHNRINVVVPHGCGWGHPPRDYPRWTDQRAYDAIASLMQQGKLTAPGIIKPIVSLSEAGDIFRLIKDEPDQVIKYAVRF